LVLSVALIPFFLLFLFLFNLHSLHQACGRYLPFAGRFCALLFYLILDLVQRTNNQTDTPFV
jgi:hypothetical protein